MHSHSAYHIHQDTDTDTWRGGNVEWGWKLGGRKIERRKKEYLTERVKF